MPQEGFVRETVDSWPNVSPLNGRHQPDIESMIQKNRSCPPLNQPGGQSIQSADSFGFSSTPFESYLIQELEDELLSPMEFPMCDSSFGTSPSPVFNFSPASPAPSMQMTPAPPSVNSPKMYNFASIQHNNPMSPMSPVQNFITSTPSHLRSPMKQNSPKYEVNLVDAFGVNSTTMPNTLNMAANAFVTTSSHVSPAIADRQKKLEKYRQKRSKRKSSDRDCSKRSQAASVRQRDELGHFVPEKKAESVNNTPISSLPSTPSDSNSSIHDVISLLFESKKESYELKTKLALVFDEMLSLRKKAEEESAAKEEIKKQLENQQKINNMLMQQNRLLWSTVPHNEVFSTKLGSVPSFNVNAFREKVDLSKIDLNCINSPHLEAAKAEEQNFAKRWEEMSFLMGAIHHPQQDSANNKDSS